MIWYWCSRNHLSSDGTICASSALPGLEMMAADFAVDRLRVAMVKGNCTEKGIVQNSVMARNASRLTANERERRVSEFPIQQTLAIPLPAEDGGIYQVGLSAAQGY